MNTTVLNLESLGVTEYSTAFTGLAGDYESTAAGLAKVGGTLDGAAPILPAVTFSMALEGDKKRRVPHFLYVFGTGVDKCATTVLTNDGDTHRYTAITRHDRVARFTLGRGIRDNYLQLKIEGGGRGALAIDQLDFVTTESTTRRL